MSVRARRNLNQTAEDEEQECYKCKLSSEVDNITVCENCLFWFHHNCVNLNDDIVSKIGNWYCVECRDANPGLEIEWSHKDESVSKDVKRKHYFPVEEILKHKVDKFDIRHFLIHWEAYGVADRTWEPEINLNGCLVKLQNYLERNNLPYSEIEGLLGADKKDKKTLRFAQLGFYEECIDHIWQDVWRAI